MTQIDAKIVADSINIHGDRITTYLLNGLYSLDRLSVNNSKSMFGWCNNFKGFVSYRYIVESN